jgi:hypothetical protein
MALNGPTADQPWDLPFPMTEAELRLAGDSDRQAASLLPIARTLARAMRGTDFTIIPLIVILASYRLSR